MFALIALLATSRNPLEGGGAFPINPSEAPKLIVEVT